MVPNLSKGAGIKGTALYVLHDVRDESERAIGAALTPEHQTAHRVGMTTTRNLSTDDPELAWRLMCATARNQEALKQAAGVHKGGRPSKYQCGHIALSWEHETKPDAAEMQRAAEGALKALGWEKLQALIVEHKDHDHSHCHIVVNLVDPETGRNAPNSKNEYEKLQRWAHEYDKARGLEVCPQRAARMERAPDDPTPAAPAQRWLSRKEYEAVRDAERAEHRGQALDRYREAAAAVKEQYRPEWSTLHCEQRAELRSCDKEQATTLRALERATELHRKRASDFEKSAARGIGVARQSGLIDFYNEYRATVWRGLEGQLKPGDNHTLLTPAFLKAAIERAHVSDRKTLLERHQESKTELQTRHTDARQEAYRQAWKRPEPAQVVTLDPKAQAIPDKRSSAGIGVAAALAASAAGIAAYAIHRQQKEGGDRPRDPEQDLAKASERIRNQPSRAANTNEIARELKTEDQKPPPASAPAARDEVAILRARIERERQTHQVQRDRGHEIERHRTPRRD